MRISVGDIYSDLVTTPVRSGDLRNARVMWVCWARQALAGH